ncbi:peptidase M16 [Tetragenococcus halophilus]|uniref:EF-P 5-aminopentanol modification-associated protein YfmF n=1 Tax=Tetragenococcus halophilus TaxID=51669 RepID=UPI001927793F|nr:pitrilysin family protein [Tetragenococcus halophilus]MCF1674893.1 insulinase family protein [Tetragenococcus halophilus]GEQ38051.1 peptidase M16 [Tetragenococcus halophilus]GEQ40313.1 peptidase M16 [Tetragenococcus halophilus]GEQ42553.1 peptidase M16 [Tetragenococcus halophilus]GEQ44811.1 peptidase M16 [Tetragenococcus halophilus]
MAISLQPGVKLTVIPTEKFKTVRLFVRFSTKHQKAVASKRALLTNLLETNSFNYPTQTKLSEKLADLYGASFGLNVSKKGNIHQVNLMMNLVNGKFINEQDIFSEGIKFIQEILFHPNIKEGAFDQETFQREKENMMDYLESIKEDKQTLAALRLQELYFAEDIDQKTPSFGTKEDLNSLSAYDLVQTYHEMMTQDQIDIFVVGDIEEERAKEAIQSLPFSPRSSLQTEIFYKQGLKAEVQSEVLYEPVVQAKLNLAYQTSIYYNDQKRFSLLVFNGLFGGFPHSKLFINVREKASLAYYASSTFDSFRGIVTVQTGIDSKDRSRVLSLIEKQLESLKSGDFTESELQQTKVMLKNQFLLSLDSSRGLIEIAYLKQWFSELVEDEKEFEQKIMAVSKEDVKKVAADLQLQAIFTIDKEVAHE